MEMVEQLCLLPFLVFMFVMFAAVCWLTWKDMLDFRHIGLWRFSDFRKFARWFGFIVSLLGMVMICMAFVLLVMKYL